MSGSHKDFDATAVPQGCSFTLGGREWHCRSVSDVPFSYWEELADETEKLLAPTGDEPAEKGSPAAMVSEIRGLYAEVLPTLRALIVPEEVDEIIELVRKRGGPVSLAKAKAVVEYIASETFKRPTVRSSSRAAGSRKTGRTSKGASSSRATARKPSARSAPATRSTRRSPSSTTAPKRQTG